MEIKIETPTKLVMTNLAELTQDERSALASLLGIASLKAELFQAFREAPKFRKISSFEVYRTCPKNRRFPLVISVLPAEDTVAEPLIKILLEHEPSARYRVKKHSLSGWCPECKRRHGLTRYSLLVTMKQDGVPYTKAFEV